MPPKSNSRESKKGVQDAESEYSESNNSESTKPTINANARRRSGDTSTSTTNEPSSSSATVSTSVEEARQPTSQSAILPAATATAAAAPTVPLSGKKPRRAGSREQFLQKVRQTSTHFQNMSLILSNCNTHFPPRCNAITQLRVMLDRESQNYDATVHWSTDGNSFYVNDQAQFEEVGFMDR